LRRNAEDEYTPAEDMKCEDDGGHCADRRPIGSVESVDDGRFGIRDDAHGAEPIAVNNICLDEQMFILQS
jgi:hypothetical protein